MEMNYVDLITKKFGNLYLSSLSFLSKMHKWLDAHVSDFAALAPFAIILSVLVARQAIHNHAEVARKKATLDLIEKRESNDYYQSSHDVFKQIRKNNEFSHLKNPQSEEWAAKRKKVQQYLNHYELISIGIERKILDADTYRYWMESAFIRDWNASAKFIQDERWVLNERKSTWEYNSKLYENYALKVAEWDQGAIVLNETFSGPPITAASREGKVQAKTSLPKLKFRVINGI